MCRSEGSGTFIFGTSNGSTQRLINPGMDLSNAWHHIAMVKSGTSQKLYIDGTQRGSVLTHSESVQNVSAPWEFGGNSNQSSYVNSYFDEIRFSNTARYTANFTPSTTAFTSDANTKLLIHGESKAAVTASDSMDLISTTITAESTPTKADIIIQTEDEVGTATINTDVKVGVSRDALNYVETTLVNKGTWGTNKHILAANDVTIPGLSLIHI